MFYIIFVQFNINACLVIIILELKFTQYRAKDKNNKCVMRADFTHTQIFRLLSNTAVTSPLGVFYLNHLSKLINNGNIAFK